jgi:hypothetical protein
MKDKIEQIFDKHHYGYGEYNKDEIIKELLVLFSAVGRSEQLVCDENKLDCPYDFTSRCTMGRCDCKPKAN